MDRVTSTSERAGGITRLSSTALISASSSLYLKPHIGSISLAKLKPAHVTELVTRLSERGGVKGRPLSAKSVSHAFALLRGARAKAQRQELVARNVADVVETPSIPRSCAIALMVEEVHTLLAAADETRWGPFLRVALGCRARRGELLALRWSHVDLKNATLTIAKSLSEPRAGVAEKATKTDRVRIVALPELAVNAFRRQRRVQASERLAAGPGSSTASMSFSSRWVAISPRSAQRRRLEFSHGVSGSRRPNFMRFATLGSSLIAPGVDPRTTASVLGDSSPTVTLTIYLRFVAGVQKVAVANIDDRLNAAMTKSSKG